MRRFILHKERQRKAAYEEIATLELEGKWEVVIRKFQPTRSTDQNNLYWKWLEVIASHTGDDKDSIHEYFKNKYGFWKTGTALGDAISIPVSTTKYTKKQFSEYMNKIEAEMATMEITLPHPDDSWMFDGGILFA